MGDYFQRFGMPNFGGHAFARCLQRNISLAAVGEALRREPVPGTAPGTLWFQGDNALVVVDADTGQFITMWTPDQAGRGRGGE